VLNHLDRRRSVADDHLSQAGFRGGSEGRTIRPPERRTSPDATTEEVSE